MSGAGNLDTEIPEPPKGSRGRQPSLLRRLSDRTSLRAKLITAVLGLVILAITAISIASVVMIRQYVTTRPDGDLTGQLAFTTSGPPGLVGIGTAWPTKSNIVEGVQVPGQQLAWAGGFNGPRTISPDPLPRLPTHGLWTGKLGSGPTVRSFSAQAGTHTWRVVAQTVQAENPTTGQPEGTAILVFAEDVGDINALTMRLVMFDLIVGGAIVLVIAAAGAAVVRANLRPLDDIELTAGQIAAGHLGHRVPEGDPRTEVGSLGRSLNAMLTQIERAFRSQAKAERAAHLSEERMRRFIADAAHELRTPLTTIRGFAAHYRQRGGAHALAPAVSPDVAAAGAGAGAGAGKSQSSRTGAAVPAYVNVVSGGRAGAGAGAPAGQGGDQPAGTGAGEWTAADLDHLMGRVEAEATRMGLLVEDLLTLARIDQQRPLAVAPVDLLSLAVDAVHDARIVSPGRPIDLIVAPGTAFIVNGDEARLRQVLANLVNNALTHTPSGTPIRVKIASGTLAAPTGHGAGSARFAAFGSAGAADGGAGAGFRVGEADADDDDDAGAAGGGRHPGPAVVLDIEDDGPGMTTDQAQRVFERFYRADAARNRASGGTGLGLAIVHGLVTAHGGTVAVRTAPGQGADFQVRLPLSPDVLAADPEDE
jgi:two-component system OmpR family sensor kinase